MSIASTLCVFLSHLKNLSVIPGTGKPEHLLDNLAAGTGPLPDTAQRRRMLEYFESS